MERRAHVRLMADYNRWMNARLYAAAATLDEAAVHDDRGAFFGSVFGTLNHLMVADLLWLKRFATHPTGAMALAPIQHEPVPTALDQRLCDTLAELADRRARLDAVIADWADTLTESDLDVDLAYRNSKGVPATRNFFALLMHFFNHQTHHRGQVTTLLSQSGVDMGPTDLLLRIPDLGDEGHAA
ncbi:DUF664 domain-containing protein [Nitrogeniibacter mangrovi]|uniref:DUF664 domain-containing protein n=1 Tax=Nitrogeniibacter mangrovi TaxID=2016596 RepID=A0A6C1B312_9RHOO|nr:DinB family protein [Nitrogeniibacter mangrovi]QID16604.1 DUF664 domain-containing protein [Nitrogeniibacter mangrovi]